MNFATLQIAKIDEIETIICLAIVQTLKNQQFNLFIRNKILKKFYLNFIIICENGENVILSDSSQDGDTISGYNIKRIDNQNQLKEAIILQKKQGEVIAGTIISNDQTIYYGQMSHWVAHGKGEYYDIYDHHIIYKGEFYNGKYSGEGISYAYNQKVEYIGQFKNGKRHGNGITYNDQEQKIYEGEFQNDLMFGPGIKYNQKGEIEFKGYFAYNEYDSNLQLLAAANNEDIEMVKELIENKGISASYEKYDPGTWGAFSRQSPIHGAIQSGNVELVKYLLEKGASLQSKNEDYNWKGSGSSKTAFQLGLQESLNQNNAKMLELLLKYGGDPNLSEMHEAHTMRTDQSTITYPLIDSIERNSQDFVKLLLKAGAKPNSEFVQRGSCENGQRWDSKLSALHIACSKKNAYITKVLIKYGANVNAFGHLIETTQDKTITVPEDNDPRSEDYLCRIINKFSEITPLNIAVIKNQCNNACILLLNGANINLNATIDKKIQKSNYELCKSDKMKSVLEGSFSIEQMHFLPKTIKQLYIQMISCLKKRKIAYRREIFQEKCFKYLFQFQFINQ